MSWRWGDADQFRQEVKDGWFRSHRHVMAARSLALSRRLGRSATRPELLAVGIPVVDETEEERVEAERLRPQFAAIIQIGANYRE